MSKFKKGDTVVIARVIDTDPKPSTVASWIERIGDIAIIESVKDYMSPIRYGITVNTKHIGDWLEDELEPAKNHIVTNILNDL